MIDEVAAIADAGGGGPKRDDEPVELLVQLAEDGEIDPWDIDIVAVTDAYLAKIEEADLRLSGRALFYASVLLRMKSEILLEQEVEEPEPEMPPEPHIPGPWDPEGPVGPDPINALEREMDRRLDRKRARGKPETLDELVRELRDIERRRWWKSHRSYDTSGSPRGFARGTQTIEYHHGDDRRMADEPTEMEVTGATHSEDVDELVDRVWDAVSEQFDAGRREVLFAEIDAVAGSRVRTYLGVLFLADRGRIRLEQDGLFGDLWIVDPAVVPAE